MGGVESLYNKARDAAEERKMMKKMSMTLALVLAAGFLFAQGAHRVMERTLPMQPTVFQIRGAFTLLEKEVKRGNYVVHFSTKLTDEEQSHFANQPAPSGEKAVLKIWTTLQVEGAQYPAESLSFSMQPPTGDELAELAGKVPGSFDEVFKMEVLDKNKTVLDSYVIGTRKHPAN